MRLYEGLIIFVPEATVEARKKHLEFFEGLVAKHGGAIRNKAEWGKKQIGYAIKKNRDGYFVVYDFDAAPAAVREIERGLLLEADVLKFMITLKIVKAIKPKKKKIKKSAAAAKPEPAAAS